MHKSATLMALLAAAPLLCSSSEALAANYKQAVIRKVLGSQEITIDGVPAGVGRYASTGAKIATGGKTRAELLFDLHTLGRMRQQSRILLGETCIDLDPGSLITINGRLCGAIGKTKQAFATRSTFDYSRDESGTYTVAVLVGQVVVGEGLPAIGQDYNILKRYPSISPSIGIGASAYTNTKPSSGGLIFNSLDAFIPLSQTEARKITYLNASVALNYDGYSGVTAEVGHRWFMPSSKSTGGIFIGYGGYETPSCINSLVNLGGYWAPPGWRVGASGGVKVDGCQSGFSYGALNLSHAIARLSARNSVYLGISPYYLWGNNIFSASNSNGSGNSASPGGMITLNVPLSDALTINAFSAVDSIYGFSIGGRITYRIPLGGGRLIRDPNRDELASVGRQVSSGKAPSTSSGTSSRPSSKTMQESESYQQEIVIEQGSKAIFEANGNLLEIVPMKPKEISQRLNSALEGFNPLPESELLAEAAYRQGVLTNELASVAGLSFLETARLPVSSTVETPFTTSRPPTSTYACLATQEGKAYAEDRLRKRGRDEDANRVRESDEIYYGPDDNVASGFPATTSKSRAYRFANGAACDELNARILGDSKYRGPSNPLQTVILN